MNELDKAALDHWITREPTEYLDFEEIDGREQSAEDAAEMERIANLPPDIPDWWDDDSEAANEAHDRRRHMKDVDF